MPPLCDDHRNQVALLHQQRRLHLVGIHHLASLEARRASMPIIFSTESIGVRWLPAFALGSIIRTSMSAAVTTLPRATARVATTDRHRRLGYFRGNRHLYRPLGGHERKREPLPSRPRLVTAAAYRQAKSPSLTGQSGDRSRTNSIRRSSCLPGFDFHIVAQRRGSAAPAIDRSARRPTLRLRCGRSTAAGTGDRELSTATGQNCRMPISWLAHL